MKEMHQHWIHFPVHCILSLTSGYLTRSSDRSGRRWADASVWVQCACSPRLPWLLGAQCWLSASGSPRSLLERRVVIPPDLVNQSRYFNSIPRFFLCILKLEKPCFCLLFTWVFYFIVFLSICFQNVWLAFCKMHPHEVNITSSKQSLGKALCCSKKGEWEIHSFETKVQIIWFKIAAFGYFVVRIIGMLDAGGKWLFIFKTIFFT